MKIITEETVANSRAFLFLLEEYCKLLRSGKGDLEFSYNNGSPVTYALDDDDSLLGAAVWSIDKPKRQAWLLFAAVDENRRQEGIYTKIFSQVEVETKSRGAVSICSIIHVSNLPMQHVATSQSREMSWYKTKKSL